MSVRGERGASSLQGSRSRSKLGCRWAPSLPLLHPLSRARWSYGCLVHLSTPSPSFRPSAVNCPPPNNLPPFLHAVPSFKSSPLVQARTIRSLEPPRTLSSPPRSRSQHPPHSETLRPAIHRDSTPSPLKAQPFTHSYRSPRAARTMLGDESASASTRRARRKLGFSFSPISRARAPGGLLRLLRSAARRGVHRRVRRPRVEGSGSGGGGRR